MYYVRYSHAVVLLLDLWKHSVLRVILKNTQKLLSLVGENLYYNIKHIKNITIDGNIHFTYSLFIINSFEFIGNN